MTYRTNDRIIELSDGRRASFPYPIAEVIDFENLETLVVRLKIPPKSQFNENIFGLGFDGVVRWQIPRIDHVTEDSPYTGMRRLGRDLETSNWDGLILTIDPKTGVILRQNYQK